MEKLSQGCEEAVLKVKQRTNVRGSLACCSPGHGPLCSCPTVPLIDEAKLVFSEPFLQLKMVTMGILYVNIMHEVSLLLRDFLV